MEAEGKFDFLAADDFADGFDSVASSGSFTLPLRFRAAPSVQSVSRLAATARLMVPLQQGHSKGAPPQVLRIRSRQRGRRSRADCLGGAGSEEFQSNWQDSLTKMDIRIQGLARALLCLKPVYPGAFTEPGHVIEITNDLFDLKCGCTELPAFRFQFRLT